MGWLGRGALVASVIALPTCTSPEPPRDAGLAPTDTMVVDVPVDLLVGPGDVQVVLDETDCAVAVKTDALSSPPDFTCPLAR